MIRLIGRSVGSQKVVKDFCDVHFSCVAVEGRVIDSNMDGFSGNLFAVFVYFLEVGDVGLGWLLEMLFVNCIGNMIIVFFYSISKHLLHSPM